MEQTRSPRWREHARGGKLGNWFFLVLARYRVTAAIAGFFLFWVALYFLIVTPRARRVSCELARLTGRGATALRRLLFAFRHFRMYATMLFDRLLILHGEATRFRFDHRNKEALGQIRGQGAVMLTAHLGNWEVMGQFLAISERPVTFVMYDGVQPALKATIEAMQQGHTFDVLYTDGSPASAAAILALLAEKRVVGMMGDRTVGGKSIAAPFLGTKLRIPLGPFAIAAAARVPMLYAFAIREGSHLYAVHALTPSSMRHEAGEKRQAALERGAEEYARCLEDFTRRYPTQWTNFFPWWEDDGEEAPSRGTEGP